MRTFLVILLFVPSLSWGSSIFLNCINDLDNLSRTFFIKDDIFYLGIDYPLKLYKSDEIENYYKNKSETAFAFLNRYTLEIQASNENQNLTLYGQCYIVKEQIKN